MKTTRVLYVVTAAAGMAVLLAAGQARLSAQQNTDPAIRIGGDNLGGVVTSANGPEAGAWVIAETTELPTKFAKIVVTDDQGRYVMLGLPKATYSTRAPFHVEGGKGTTSKVVKFQLRPDPLAR